MSLGSIVVQKYGGSSVATAEKILAIADRIKTILETTPHLVVAVSAMAAVGQMAANVAHQVGTPLNLISGYVQMVREGNADPRTRERLEIVERQIQQVTGVLRSMLDHARQKSPRELVDVARVVRYACETAQSQLALAGVELRVHLDARLPSIEADATQLELVLINLIKNSLDAMSAPSADRPARSRPCRRPRARR